MPRRLLTILIFLSVGLGCAIPSRESLRPRGIDFYSEGGRSDYGPDAKFDDYRFGVNVHFDITYDDEREVDE